MILKNADQVELYANLEYRSLAYRRNEKAEFISDLWGEMFAKYDTFMATDQAIDSANYICDFARRVWDEVS